MIEYPSLLRPTATESILVAGQLINIPKVELILRPWSGAPLINHFNYKPLIDFGGRPMFAELCIYELLRLSCWEARWVETYGAPAATPYLLTNYLDVPLKQQQHQPLTDTWVAELLASIATHNNSRHGGCWDVLGWRGETILFAELKRRKKDRLQTTQPRWLEAGLQAGLQPENFMLVEWGFTRS